MEQIQLIQIKPSQLVDLIKDGVKVELLNLSSKISEIDTHSDKEFLTRIETAEFFAISLVTIHDWCKSEIIHPYKMGNRTYFKRVELVQSLLDSNRKLNK